MLTLLNADAMRIPLPADSIDTVITDPPYGLGFMGKAWDHGVPGVPFWQDALRVAKPGAMLLAFGGTRTHHRLMCAIEDAGWEIRDCIFWVYGSGFPKNHDIGKAIDKAAGVEREVVGTNPYYCESRTADPGEFRQGGKNSSPHITAPATPDAQLWDGYGTALKPAWEPIIIAMKPLDGTFAQNALKWGVAGLWVDGGRVEGNVQSTIHGKHPEGIYGNLNYILGDKFEPHPQGRWPANLIHDGSDEVVGLFPETKSGSGHVGVAGNKENPSGWMESGRTDAYWHGDQGSAARFFYCAKASPAERGEGNSHPTVKPIALMRYLCRLTKTPTGGVVLDPFSGSGSTGIAAKLEGRDFIGLDISAEYCRVAHKRIDEHLELTALDEWHNGRDTSEPVSLTDLPMFAEMEL